MHTNSKARWLGIIIILLLIINAATIVFLVIGKDRHKPPPENGGAFAFLVRELSLDSNQKAAYQQLRDQHRNSVEDLRGKLKINKDSLFDLLKLTNAIDGNIQERLDSIASLNRKIDEITFNHFKQVRAICNPQQQIKFDEVIAEAMKMQAPRKPPPPRGERPPNGDEP